MSTPGHCTCYHWWSCWRRSCRLRLLYVVCGPTTTLTVRVCLGRRRQHSPRQSPSRTHPAISLRILLATKSAHRLECSVSQIEFPVVLVLVTRLTCGACTVRAGNAGCASRHVRATWMPILSYLLDRCFGIHRTLLPSPRYARLSATW